MHIDSSECIDCVICAVVCMCIYVHIGMAVLWVTCCVLMCVFMNVYVYIGMFVCMDCALC